ncbi:MAG: sulfotransferase [Inquilinus sp.]|nr:sulfotransferase [Inquilinus sp.]
MFRRSVLAIQRLFNQVDPASAVVAEDPVDGGDAPIFLIGPPRTGSTIVYQAMVRGLDLGYISNLMALLPRFMVRMDRVHRRLGRPMPALHPGKYGFVPGLWAPSEAGKVVDRWFDPDRTGEERSAVRRMLAALSGNGGRPTIIKSPSLVLRLPGIREILPQARFVVLSRSPAFVAQSLLLGRRDPTIATDRWSGVEPADFSAHADRGLAYQVVRQCVELTRAIESNLGDLPADRIVRLRYEDFCASPRRAVLSVAEAFGLMPSPALGDLPVRFEPRDRQRVDQATWAEIQLACRELGACPATGTPA